MGEERISAGGVSFLLGKGEKNQRLKKKEGLPRSKRRILPRKREKEGGG